MKTIKQSAKRHTIKEQFISNLNHIINYAQALKDMDLSEEDLEGWIADKISTSKDDISDVKHSFDNPTEDVEKESEQGCWKGYERNYKKKKYEEDSCVKKSYIENFDNGGLKVEAAKYQGKEVTLNKPFRTPNGPKKFSVYVKNDKGNVIKVNFGDPNMEIKRDDPDAKKNFRARHNCKDKTDKTKAGYWSCKMWSGKNVSDLT
jgi:hypothetical protein